MVKALTTYGYGILVDMESIDITKLNNNDWILLTQQEWALPLLLKHMDMVAWDYLKYEEWTLPLLLKNIDRVEMYKLPDEEWTLPLYELNLDAETFEQFGIDREDYSWALPLMMKHPHVVNWDNLQSKWTLPLMETYPDLANWGNVCTLPFAISLIEKYPERITWASVWWMDESFVPLFRLMIKYPIDIPWNSINRYTYKSFMYPFLEAFPNEIDWTKVPYEEWALSLWLNNLDKVDWTKVPYEQWAFLLWANNLDNVDWVELSRYSWASSIVSENLDQIFETQINLTTTNLSIVANLPCRDKIPILKKMSIFTYDYKRIKEERNWILKELSLVLFHPDRIKAWMEKNPTKHIDEYLN